MKKLIYSLGFASLLLTQAQSAQAQLINMVSPTFTVNTPAAISGVKMITYSNDGDPANAANNWGRAIDSFWLNVPMDTTSDLLGCMSGLSSLSGKFALIERGICNFSEKAYNAQLAGAIGVVLYNNVSGGPVGMASGINGNLVNIPVLMISQADGDALRTELAHGASVTVTLTNWGLGLSQDVGIIQNSLALLHNAAMPKYELASGNPDVYKAFFGALVGNFGTQDMTDLVLTSKVSFTPAGGSSQLLLEDSVMAPLIRPLDSIIDMLSANAYSLPPVVQTGELKVDYSLSAAEVDSFIENNTLGITSLVTDSIYSKTPLNANMEPVTSMARRYGTESMWGPLFHINEGGHAAVKSQFIATAGTGLLLDGLGMSMYVFKWDDLNGDHLMDIYEMNMVGYGTKNFTAADSNFSVFTMDLFAYPATTQQLILDANSKYWFALELLNGIYIGCGDNVNYFVRSYVAANAPTPVYDYWTPIFYSNNSDFTGSTGTVALFPGYVETVPHIDSIGLGAFNTSTGLVPAITLHTTENIVNSVKQIREETAHMSIYPNPANTVLNLDFTSKNPVDNITVKVFNTLGQRVYNEVYTVNGIEKKITINTSEFASGNYFLVVHSKDNPVVGSKFTVK